MASEGNSISLGSNLSLGGSLGRDYLSHQKKHAITDGSDDDLDSSPASHVLDRAKTDRISTTKSEEDRRRRTIIVEKKGGNYGFTLQSYGIHYKKEQEIEMITYVDYVEYDGPAYKAGMREGDVILSINGTDMEKANHKTLVSFIKDCDTRMRMVVLFEDCVRKVELHMRYIQLQNVLQSKMNELEKVCLRERELLEGKWKTHSLPARKKTTSSPTEGVNNVPPSENNTQPLFYRPTLSTEDVNLGRPRNAIIPPPAQFMLTYQYLDPNCRYVLKPSTSNSSGEYFISVRPPSRSRSDHHYILTRAESAENTASMMSQNTRSHPITRSQTTSDERVQYNDDITPPTQHITNEQSQPESQQQPMSQTQQKPPKSARHCHGHSCNPCMGHFGKNSDKNGDNTSLDAYDLASPCCETHCVPTRRRSRHQKEHHHKHKHRDKESKERQRPRSQSHASPHIGQPHHHHHHHRQPQQSNTNLSENKSVRSRYFDLTAGLASHCSLHSCTSSEFAPAESSTSYTTSLSTDTLYWDPQIENTNNSRQHSIKSRQSIQHPSNTTVVNIKQNSNPIQPGMYTQRYHLHSAQIQPNAQVNYQQQYTHKPKSWDNLTTKSFGGYGYGYGYLDTTGPKQTTKVQTAQQRHSIPRKNPYGRYSTFTDIENYAPPPSQFVEETTTTMTTITTKSTENLISTQYVEPGSHCDCSQESLKSTMIQYQQTNHSQTIDGRTGYYSSLQHQQQNQLQQKQIQQQQQQSQHIQQHQQQSQHIQQQQVGQLLQAQAQQGQVQHGQSQHGLSAHVQPQHGQPQYAQPQPGQPQHAQPQQGQPQHGQPQHGQPQHAQSQHSQPLHTQSQHSLSQNGQNGVIATVSEVTKL